MDGLAVDTVMSPFQLVASCYRVDLTVKDSALSSLEDSSRGGSAGLSDKIHAHLENTRSGVNPALVDALAATWLHSRKIHARFSQTVALLLDRQTIQGLLDMDNMIGILKQAGI